MVPAPPELPRPPVSRDGEIDDTLKRLNGVSSTALGERPKEPLLRDLAQPLVRPVTLSKSSPSAAMPPSRTPTLSWQQRPTSRGSTGARTRPLSVVATENNASRSPRATPEPAYANDGEASRDQIAQALGSKDPSWFKQTAERGHGSAAYRRNQEDSMSDTTSMTGSRRLPGMSRESTVESVDEISPLPESMQSVSPSRESSIRGSVAWSQRFPSTTSLSSASDIGSPLPTLSSQRFEPPSDTTSSHGDELPTFSRTVAMTPSQGRMSPERMERPSSPTRGLGGFVQSAMLKRSDSVNKRWSAQASPGLSRGNSVASNRSGYGAPGLGLIGWSPPKDPRPSSPSRDNSPMPGSRPGSSHSHVTVTQTSKENERPSTSGSITSAKLDSPGEGGFIKPAIPHHSRAQTVGHSQDESYKSSATKSPPLSPSKIMDQKRWSPTKASWLESAINKPDSPKPKAPPPQQPSWMVEINRAKQQRGSVDLGKPANSKEVTTAGIMRSPPTDPAMKSKVNGGLPSDLHSSKAIEAKDHNTKGSTVLMKSQSLPAKSIPSIKGSDLSTHSTPLGSTVNSDPDRKQIQVSVAAEGGFSSTQSSDLEPPQPTLNEKATLPTKAKPETPPKKDFRSTLKSRQVSGGDRISSEPEFKNVFGKLKRTQTQNYVAPDELKNNILKGKAGLAVTGGPKKPERKDELKESILKQKEAMKAGIPSMTRKTSINSSTKEQDPPIPEAIAKGKGLTRSESTFSKPSSDADKGSTTPEAISRQQSLKDKPKPILPDKQSVTLGKMQKEPAANGRLAERFNPALIGMLSKGPSPMAGSVGTTRSKTQQALSHDTVTIAYGDRGEDLASGAQLTHMTKARARGPKRRLPTVAKEDSEPERAASPVQPDSVISLPNTEAKEVAQATPERSPSELPVIGAIRPLANIINNNNKTPPPVSPRKPSYPIKVFPMSEANETPPKVSQPTLSPRKPRTPVKSFDKEEVKEISSKSLQITSIEATPIELRASPSIKRKPSLSSKEEKPYKPTIASSRPLPTAPAKLLTITQAQQIPSSPAILQQAHNEGATDVDEPEISVRDAAAIWGQSLSPTTPLPRRAKSPIKLPSRKDEEMAMQEAGLDRPSLREPVGLGLQSPPVEAETSAPLDRELPTPPLNSPKSPPLPAKKPDSIAHRVVSNGTLTRPPKAALDLPSPQTSESTHHFATFFDSLPSTHPKVSIDTHAILTSHPSAEVVNDTGKIKTLRKQIWEVTSSGKKIPVPPQQEHILFEESVYLCTHVFGHPITGSRTTEVYLWCGDGVATSAVEDAHLFARKVAKENGGGTLVVLKQGKETANFLQALGGIVIIRRGSSSRGSASDTSSSSSPSNATYMLCGRQYVGQIAFDEVDFSPQSLCSAFPYIISARFGKLYLWKGRGSGADELGCARLIGMDLGLTGEIEEVDEGNEDEAFWDVFPGMRRETRRESDTEYWGLKPSCEKYATRLFSVEHESRPKSSSGFKWGRRGSAPAEDGTPTAQIREISPFGQTDLTKESIFVLDAFFEIYV